MKLRASYTVEAALLMTVILPLLTGIIYLGFYLHNVSVMQNAAYELTVLGSFESGRGDGESIVEKRKQELVSRAFPGLGQVQADVQIGKKKVSARIQGEFRIPGLIMHFFCNNRMNIQAYSEMELLQPGKQIIRMHQIKKLTEEGNEYNVSPGRSE